MLRASQPIPCAAAEMREAQPPRPNAPLDILIAEDNEVNQLVFGQILSGLGLSYRIAGNGRTAVEMYRTLKPKLILMDVSMPEMNGYEATRAIRAAEAEDGSRTPIIGVTAHALKGDREKCIEAGMDDYLPKPISPDRLGAKIGTWLERERAGEDGVIRQRNRPMGTYFRRGVDKGSPCQPPSHCSTSRPASSSIPAGDLPSSEMRFSMRHSERVCRLEFHRRSNRSRRRWWHRMRHHTRP